MNISAEIRDAFSDKAFVEELFSSQDLTTAQDLLRSRGIDMTIEETEALLDGVSELAYRSENESEELEEDQLEMVSGGFGLVATIGAVFAFVFAAGAASYAAGYYLGKHSSCPAKRKRR